MIWIFLKYQQEGLFKNVQDGISRPIGSRVIQNTKGETVLVDTLYKMIYTLLAQTLELLSVQVQALKWQ